MFEVPRIAQSLIIKQRTDVDITDIENSYYNSVYKDFSNIIKYIKRPVNNLLSIGCGVGGLEILLYKHLKEPNLYLLDKDKVDLFVYYDYAKEASKYNLNDVTKRFMMLNGVPEDKINMSSELLFSLRFDLIISIMACGFHYPVKTTLKKLKGNISRTDLIFDLRIGTNQLKYFKNKDIIMRDPKRVRVHSFV